MTKLPKLTEFQKKELSKLEPALRRAAKSGEFKTAKRITLQIQNLLRTTGHETRLMQAKNWLFESALEAGQVQTAISGFTGIIKKTNPQTRVNLEATALLAVCYLRNSEVGKAKPYIAETLKKSEKNIKSESRKRQFKQRVVQRFKEEIALVSLKSFSPEKLDNSEIHDEAGVVVQEKNEDQIFSDLGHSIPKSTSDSILDINEFSKNLLPYEEKKLLPSPEEVQEKKQLGKTIFSAFQRVLWRSLCDQDSDLYKAWYKYGMGFVISKKYISLAVISAMSGAQLGQKALAVSATAIAIKMGIETYCDAFKPKGLMIGRNEK